MVARWVWGSEIPRQLGTHWSSPGGADRSSEESEVFVGALAVMICALVAGCVILAVPALSAMVTRIALLALGGVAAGAATQWLIPTHLTMVAGHWSDAVLGAWILVHFASWAYGLVPMLIAPPVRAAR